MGGDRVVVVVVTKVKVKGQRSGHLIPPLTSPSDVTPSRGDTW